jgi:hypothetical protein
MLQPANLLFELARSKSFVQRLRIQTDYNPTHLTHIPLNLLANTASFVFYHTSQIAVSLGN